MKKVIFGFLAMASLVAHAGKESLVHGAFTDTVLVKQYQYLAEARNELASMDVDTLKAKMEELIASTPDVKNDHKFVEAIAAVRKASEGLTNAKLAEKVAYLEQILEDQESLSALVFSFSRYAWDSHEFYTAFFLSVVLFPLDLLFLPFTFSSDVTEAVLGSPLDTNSRYDTNYLMSFTRSNACAIPGCSDDRAVRAAKAPVVLALDVATSPLAVLFTIYERVSG